MPEDESNPQPSHQSPDDERVTFEDRWFVAEGSYQGKPLIMRARGHLQHLVGHWRYPRRMTVKWTIQNEIAAGLPDEAELERMTRFEERLLEALEHDMQAIAIAVVTCDGAREWIFYTSDLDESQRRINATFADDPVFPIELIYVEDPTWAEYVGIIRNCDASNDDA